jgi:GDP-L-fucose synthase
MNLKGKRVLVTGGSGFLGRVIVKKLEQVEANVFVPRSKHYNLVDYKACRRLFHYVMPQIVVHLAAFYGGIWLNKLSPARIYFKNLMMGANIIEMCRMWDVEKFVGIGTACSYPGELEGDLKENDLWKGACHDSVECYGTTKKMLVVQGRAYKKQYDLNSIHLILTNLYGEHDTFNPDRSHVVAALMRKFVEAKMNGAEKVEVWGSGKPIREFLYTEDAAEAIVKATEIYDSLEPMNIGVGIGTSIKELVGLIAKITEFKGEIIWDASKPDGAMRKVLDISKMKKVLDWYPRTSLENGLKKTISWFQTNYEEAIKRW